MEEVVVLEEGCLRAVKVSLRGLSGAGERSEEAEELMLRTKQLASQVAGANRRCQQLSEEKERDLTSWRTLAVERRDEIEKLTARVLTGGASLVSAE